MKNFTWLLVLLLPAFQAFAQTTIQGTVTDGEGTDPVPGATITVKGFAGVGTITDFNGKYSIDAPEGSQTLVFSFVGMKTQEVAIAGQTTIDVVMAADAIQMGDVVVTALGIKREKKALGYAVQEVKADEITRGGDNNVVSALSGKIAGVQITTSSGAVGSSSTIKIRGNKSFGGNTSPLFVIDGVPISNGSSSATSADFGNAAQDIDMENIESMSVLKGPAATSLYGSRGANGVILITTKKGKKGKGLGVTYTGSVAFDNVYILPDYQDQYGQGIGGSEYYWQLKKPNISYQDFGEGIWNWTPNSTADVSWGARLDQGLNVVQIHSDIDADGNRIPSPWISRPDNVRNFYETGITTSNSVSLGGGNDIAVARLTISHVDQKGTTPNTDQAKINIGFNASVQLSKKLKFDINSNYNVTSNDNLPKQGQSLMNPLYEFNNWFGRQVDVDYLEDHYLDYITHPDGSTSRLNWMTGYDGYNNNPYWNLNMNTTARKRQRTFGSISATYTVAEGIDLMLRAGTDDINEHRKTVFYSGTKGTLIGGFQNPLNGSYWEQNRSENETNIDAMLLIDKTMGEDFTFASTMGGNYRSTLDRYVTLEAGALTIPDFFTSSAVDGSPETFTSLWQRRTNSLFASSNFGYKGFLYLDLSYRQDWSSTLPKENWTYGYAASTLGFIFSDAFGITSNLFTYGKVRASYAEVGNDTSPYSLEAYYEKYGTLFTGAGGDVNMYRVSSTLPTFDLAPERTSSYEVGGEFKFFQNRMGVDLTYYSAVTRNQLMNVRLAASEGYSIWKKNAGKIQNSGVEIQLYLTPVETENFSWNISANYSKNENVILELDDEVSQGLALNTFYEATLWAKEGEEWGSLYGIARTQDENGNFLVTKKGGYIESDSAMYLGSVTPDFIGGIRNSFTYKNVSMSALIDFRIGGDIVSRTKIQGQRTGILESTVVNDQRIDGIIAEGVFEEGVVNADGDDVSGQPNDVVVSAMSYWEPRIYADMGIVDGSFVKFRELNIAYTIPKKYIASLKFQSASVSFYGRNLGTRSRC